MKENRKISVKETLAGLLRRLFDYDPLDFGIIGDDRDCGTLMEYITPGESLWRDPESPTK